MTWVLMVHPDEVDRPSVKALAASLDATVVFNRFVPRGQVIRTTQAILDFADRWGQS